MVNNKKLLGQRIKELRKKAGYTQEQLAELINLETSSLSGIESGRHFPSLITIEKIANILDIKLKSLFDFDSLVSPEIMRENIVKNINRLDDVQLNLLYKIFDGYQ